MTARPRLVYDDDCGLCARSARFVARHADVEPVAFSSIDEGLRERLPPDFERCAHLVTGDAVYSCGEAMERAYELTGLPAAGVLPALRRVPGHDAVLEAGYRLIADHRSAVGRLARWLF